MAYPYAGYGVDPNVMSAGYDYDESDSLESESSESDDYEYQARMITRETHRPRDVIRAPTPPPIIKRVVERAPTPEAPVMERVSVKRNELNELEFELFRLLFDHKLKRLSNV